MSQATCLGTMQKDRGDNVLQRPNSAGTNQEQKMLNITILNRQTSVEVLKNLRSSLSFSIDSGFLVELADARPAFRALSFKITHQFEIGRVRLRRRDRLVSFPAGRPEEDCSLLDNLKA